MLDANRAGSDSPPLPIRRTCADREQRNLRSAMWRTPVSSWAEHRRLQGGDAVRLSRKQRTVVSYIEHNPKFAAFATAAELGGRVGVHPSTVVRLAQMLGYAGFPEFQAAIRHQYLNSLDARRAACTRTPGEHVGDVVLASIDQDIRNLSTTRSRSIEKPCAGWRGSLPRRLSVLILGAGSHGRPGPHLQPSLPLHGPAGRRRDSRQRGAGGAHFRLGPGDVVIGTAAWWVVQETREALCLRPRAGATTVAIVDSRASGLAQVADHVLVTRTESVSFFQSMSGPLAVLNALIAEIAASSGTDVQERMQVSSEPVRAASG